MSEGLRYLTPRFVSERGASNSVHDGPPLGPSQLDGKILSDLFKILDGSPGPDTIYGGNRGEMISGFQGSDFLSGGNGSDLIYGGSGNDFLSGGSGKDTIFGDSGADFLSGGNHRDDLNGGAGDDALYGGGGADTLDGGAGDDALFGGGGADTFVFASDTSELADTTVMNFNARQGDRIDVDFDAISSIDHNFDFQVGPPFVEIFFDNGGRFDIITDISSQRVLLEFLGIL